MVSTSSPASSYDPSDRCSGRRRLTAEATTQPCSSGAHVRDDGLHPAVDIARFVEAELEEDLRDVRLDGALGDEDPRRDRAVRDGSDVQVLVDTPVKWDNEVAWGGAPAR